MSVTKNTGTVDVAIQDQTTPIIALRAHIIKSAFVLDGDTTEDSFTAGVITGHSGIDSDWVCIQQWDEVNQIPRFFQAKVVTAAATLLTFDRPLDFAFESANVLCSNFIDVNLADKVGSVGSPLIFKIEPKSGRWDITRMIVQIFSAGTMDDGKFGSIASLQNGLTVRRNNGFIYNICNWKNQGEFKALAFDGDYASKPPAGTGNGWAGRLTFAGSNKIGVAVRLASILSTPDKTEDDSLEVVLSDSLAAFAATDTVFITFEGHVVDE